MSSPSISSDESGIGLFPGAKCKRKNGTNPVLSKHGFWQGTPFKCFMHKSIWRNRTDAVLLLQDLAKCSAAPSEQEQEEANVTTKYVKVASVYRCHPTDACVEYNESKTPEEASCRDGHSGVACSECLPGWQVVLPVPYFIYSWFIGIRTPYFCLSLQSSNHLPSKMCGRVQREGVRGSLQKLLIYPKESLCGLAMGARSYSFYALP